MRKFFLSIIILTIFCSCNFVIAQDEELQVANVNQNIQLQQNEDIQTQADETKQEQIDKLNQEMGLGEQRQIVIDDVQSSPNDNKTLTKKVVPDTRSELTKMVKMFLKVMLAVAISSVVIFVVLLFIRRFYAPAITLEDLDEDNEKKITLDTPQNKNEALKTFLDKTKEV